jgi:hypothetical protein
LKALEEALPKYRFIIALVIGHENGALTEPT